MTLLSLIALPRDKYDTDEDGVPPKRKKVELGNECAAAPSSTTKNAMGLALPAFRK
jgi:hypothetical protein